MRRKLMLTNTAVQAAQPGEELWDEAVRGLHLRCFTHRKSWYMYFRTKAGDERRPKLEDVTVLSLAQAREIAKEMLAAVASGKDPMAELYQRVYNDHWSKVKTGREYKRMYESYVAKALGRERVTDVTYDMVAKLHQRHRDRPYQANRVLAMLSKMFNYAARPLKWAPLNVNPCEGVARFPELKRKKFFRPEQLAALVPAITAQQKAHPRGAAYLLFMLYTGCRPLEAAVITPEMVDGAVVRLDDAKTGQRDIYMSPQAELVLSALPWVKGKPILGSFPRALWRQLRDSLGLEGMWARDMRRTFGTASLATAHGAQTGELLGHKSAQTTKIYTQLVEDSAKAAAAAAADQIDQMARRT